MDSKILVLILLTFCFVPDTVYAQWRLRSAYCNADFIDSEGDNCRTYLDSKWCSPNGGYGENWEEGWGTMSDYGMDGNDGFDCPECGCGGESRSDEVPRCHSTECWCISAGGNTCSWPDTETGLCDPDECYEREDCPGNGYWCIDGFEQKVLDLEDKVDNIDVEMKRADQNVQDMFKIYKNVQKNLQDKMNSLDGKVKGLEKNVQNIGPYINNNFVRKDTFDKFRFQQG